MKPCSASWATPDIVPVWLKLLTGFAASGLLADAAYVWHRQSLLAALSGALLWLTGFAGAIVVMEPSPYEVTSLLTIFRPLVSSKFRNDIRV